MFFFFVCFSFFFPPSLKSHLFRLLQAHKKLFEKGVQKAKKQKKKKKKKKNQRNAGKLLKEKIRKKKKF